MIAAFRALADRFLGRGDATITVPSFDGALKPNQILERAETIGQFDAPEDIATDGKALYIADGAAVLRLDSTATTEVRRFDRPITALCCLPDGGMAVALDGREVQVFATPSASPAAATLSDPSMNAINALSPGSRGTLIATNGSTARPCEQWVHDLMERGRTGKVLSLDIASRRVGTIASGLHFAFGACAAGDDDPGQRKLATPSHCHQPGWRSARHPGQPAGLSFAAFAGGFRRLLAHRVRRTHPARRIRAA